MKILPLFACATFVNAIVFLQPEKRSIVGRGLTSWGGYALLVNPCPSGTSTCGTASCCPTGYTCNADANTDVPLCCPSSESTLPLLHQSHTLTIAQLGTDCTATVKALNACADQSWELYQFGGLFCCPSDSVGTYSSAGRQCIARSLPIPTSISLSTVRIILSYILRYY